MTAEQRHTIGKQYLDLRFTGSEREALRLQASVSALCRQGLAAAIGRILDRHAADGGVVQIDRLEIDAGTVAPDKLEEYLPAMIAEALDKALREMAMPGAEVTDEAIKRPVGKRLPEEKAAVDALLFFLRHGTLPATFRPLSHESFEAQLLEAWNRSGMVRQTAETLAFPEARHRFLFQFAQPVAIGLLARLWPGARQIIENLLGRFRSAGLPADSCVRLQRELLDKALALSATGRGVASEELQAMLAEIAMSLPEVAESCRAGMPDEKTVTETRSRTKQNPLVPDARTARQTHDSAPADHRDGGHAPQSAPEAQHPENQTPETASPDAQRSHSSHPPAGRPGGGSSAASRDASSGIFEADTNARSTTTFSREHTPGPAQPRSSGAQTTRRQIGTTPNSPEAVREHPDERRGLYVENAGLVLLHPFLPQFFRALKIAGDEVLFRPGQALQLLHFLATGSENVPEYELVLPKILCGLEPASLAGKADTLSDEEKEESEALLSAVTRHWDVLKNTGIDTLRETYLKRNGKLTRRHDGGWLLQVESKSFDILLDSLPWGISMIKLPWMPRMLRVEWLYHG